METAAVELVILSELLVCNVSNAAQTCLNSATISSVGEVKTHFYCTGHSSVGV